MRLAATEWLLVAAWLCAVAGGLDNSMARRPPLGWMSWGYYACGVHCDKHPDKCLNEALIMSVADSLEADGYAEAGYEYIIIDDCWAEKHRGPSGELVADRARFPRGMKFLADYIHSRGLKFGLYGNPGEVTCMRYPGSRHHLRQDAETFASWDVDYIKFDGCFVEEAFLNTVYEEFGHYLNQTGRPIVYSCSWPYYIQFVHGHKPNFTRVASTCNLWRNYHDVVLNWGSVRAIIMYHARADTAAALASHVGPGHWSDPDMIVVGTGALSPGQARAQLATWAALAAPLLLSCELRRAAAWERALLLNAELLAIDQDPLGLPAAPYKLNAEGLTLWVRRLSPLQADRWPAHALALVNVARRAAAAALAPHRYGLRSPAGYSVMDVFAQKLIRNISVGEDLVVTVPAEDAVMYSLFPL